MSFGIKRLIFGHVLHQKNRGFLHICAQRLIIIQHVLQEVAPHCIACHPVQPI